MCCGTKRLVEIQCPSDCAYLAAARVHPPAATVRQQQRDVASLVHWMRDFSERQSQLFVLINSFLRQYKPSDLQSHIDDDVVEAVAALAGTFETASRGVIYDHRPAGLPADRLATALRTVIEEAGKHAGTAFDRDAAVVLRRIEEGARETRSTDPSNRRAYLDLLNRVLTEERDAGGPSGPGGSAGDATKVSRLIVP